MSSAPTAPVYMATGRRKTAVARIRLTPGEGRCTVNGRPFEEHFRIPALRPYVEQPLSLANLLNKFDIDATIRGGGVVGQAGALRHALSRALVASDPALRPVLKSAGCLTRDPRMKERKKAGRPGARKRFQFSKR